MQKTAEFPQFQFFKVVDFSFVLQPTMSLVAWHKLGVPPCGRAVLVKLGVSQRTVGAACQVR